MRKKLALLSLFFMLILALAPVSAQAAWKTTSAGKVYTDSKGKKVTGWQTIGGARYYFNSKGIMQTKWKTIKKKVYYFGTDGKMRTGWLTLDPYTYYLGSDGVRRAGWQSISDGKSSYRYYFGSHGRMLKGVQTIDGKRYIFGSNGRMQRGFVTLNGKTYYANVKTGVLAQDEWITINAQGHGYYFKEDSTMAKSTWINGRWVGADGLFTGTINYRGFVTDGSRTYYYDNSGKKVTGWLKLSGKLYYLNPSGGALMKGWFTVNGQTYHADTKSGLVSVKTWIGKKYMGADGAMSKGFVKIGSNTYYFNNSGDYLTGWNKIGNKYYYFSSKGVMAVNAWVKVGKKYYHVDKDGAKQFGVQNIGGKFYYFAQKNNDGARLRKWINYNGKRYYADPKTYVLKRNTLFTWGKYKYYAKADCSLAYGLMKVGNDIYYFTSPKGRAITNAKRAADGATYYFGSDGKAVKKKWVKVSGKYYYFSADGKMAVNTVVDGYVVGAHGVRGSKAKAGWVTVNGQKKYYENDKVVTGWKTISGAKYYFDESGNMTIGPKTIGNKKYFFLATGQLCAGYGSLPAAGGENGVLYTYTVNNSGVITSCQQVKGSGTGYKMALEAVKYIGTKYVYGGNSLTTGLDCSAFVQQMHGKFGIKIPRVTWSQYSGSDGYGTYASKVSVKVSASSLKPGDLIFYNNLGHVTMYIGNGMIVHASNSQAFPNGGVKVSNYLYSTSAGAVRYWK